MGEASVDGGRSRAHQEEPGRRGRIRDVRKFLVCVRWAVVVILVTVGVLWVWGLPAAAATFLAGAAVLWAAANL